MYVPVLFIWIALSAVVGWFGKDRKFGFWGYSAASLILSPLVGALLVFASDRKPLVSTADQSTDSAEHVSS